jgi:hypothetical protein
MVFVKTKKWEVQGSNLAPPSIKQPTEPLGYVHVATLHRDFF